MMKRLLVMAGLACATAGFAAAQAPPPPKPAQGTSQPPATKTPPAQKPAGSQLSAGDRTFVREAAMAGMAEVELGRLATEKASNADVKQFGQRMVDDHGKANDELKAAASQKQITLPTEPGPSHKAAHNRLSELSGAEFDRAYMARMVTDHNQAVQLFTRESKMGRDADLKAWAAKTLPTLQEHQKMARDLNAKVRGSATKTNTAAKKPGS
jgi:putative membrane protein